MRNPSSDFFLLGLAIIIMSSSGTLGRFIELPPPITIWLRCVIGAIGLWIYLKIKKRSITLGSSKHLWSLITSSALLAIHWITYFYSLQLSNVAVGMLALFTYPTITTILEPIILKTKFQWSNLLLGGIAFAGISLLVPEFTIQNKYTLGIIVGVLSSICYSLRNLLLKKRVGDQSPTVLMYFQLVIVSIILVPLLFFIPFDTGKIMDNWLGIILLGLLTTAVGHTLFVHSFQRFTISTVSIISSLTPLSGIILGYLFLGEIPRGNTFIGGSVILLTASIATLKSIREQRGT